MAPRDRDGELDEIRQLSSLLIQLLLTIDYFALQKGTLA